MKYFLSSFIFLFANLSYANICTPDPAKRITKFTCQLENNLYKEKGKASYLNADGEEITTHYDVVLFAHDGLRAVKKDGKYGFIKDVNGAAITPLMFDDAKRFSEGLAVVRVNNKYGAVNTQGNVVIAPRFDYIEPFKAGVAIVQNNEQFGAIDTKGNLIIPTIYQLLFSFNNGIFTAKAKEKYGFVDKNNNTVLPFKYKKATQFSENIAAVVTLDDPCTSNCMMRLINKKGKFLSDNGFPYVGLFIEGFADVQKNGKYGFINKKGEVVVPIIYDRVGRFTEGMASVGMNGKDGFVNTSGKVVIPIKYDMAFMFTNGQYLVRKSRYLFTLDRQGNPIKEDYRIKKRNLCFDMKKGENGTQWVERVYKCK